MRARGANYGSDAALHDVPQPPPAIRPSDTAHEVIVLPLPSPLAQTSAPVVTVVVLAVALVAIGAFVVATLRRRREDRGLATLLARDRSLAPTTTPCGLPPEALAGTVATPRGDRRFGLRHGVAGPIEVEVNGHVATLDCAAFQWWHEERNTSHGRHGTSTHYVTRRQPGVAARLPLAVPVEISLAPESLLGRTGLTRGGHQLESAEFNRRFRVASADRTLTIQLLAPQLQQRLIEEFTGRSIHLAGDLLLLGGAPSHRDASLPRAIGELPAVRQDLQRLLDAVPPRFWRAVAASRRPG